MQESGTLGHNTLVPNSPTHGVVPPSCPKKTRADAHFGAKTPCLITVNLSAFCWPLFQKYEVVGPWRLDPKVRSSLCPCP